MEIIAKINRKHLLLAGAILLLILLSSFGILARPYVAPHGSEITNLARRYLGTPYQYGGASPAGFDCSGFTLYIYKQKNASLPHSSKEQYRKLLPIRMPHEGDLVFFRTSGNTISHVGIYLGAFEFIHAPGKGKPVRIDDIRNPYWRKVYAGARSVL